MPLDQKFSSNILQQPKPKSATQSLPIAPSTRKELIGTIIQRVKAGPHSPLQFQQDVLQLQQTIGNRAVVQLLASLNKPAAEDMHQVAAAGVQGTGDKLPHLDKIQKSFGSYDVSHVQAYTDSNANAASRTIHSEAYTTGNKIAFASATPTLHTTAHEAAHAVVQANTNVQLNDGIGQAGDEYERHADAVADKVVKEESAEGLLREYATDGDALTQAQTSKTSRLTSPANQSAEMLQRKLDWGKKVTQVIDLIPGKRSPDWVYVSDYVKNLTHYEKTIIEAFLIPDTKLKYVFSGNYGEKLDQLKPLVKKLSKVPTELFNFDNIQWNNPKEREIILNVLDKIILSCKDDNLPRITRIELENDEGLRVTWEFLPRKKLNKSSSENKFDLSYFKTIIDDNQSEGFGATATYSDTQSNGIPLKTKVTWSPPENNIGQRMDAIPLGPDHRLGSKPSSQEAKNAVDDMQRLAGDKVKYVAGHLLNEQLGGPGDNTQNLAPITSKANALHKSDVENPIKRLVNWERKWVNYSVQIKMGNMNRQKLQNRRTSTKKIAEKYNCQYPAELVASWSLADGQGGMTTVNKNEVIIKIDDPILINSQREEQNTTSESFPRIPDDSSVPYFSTKPKYNDVILSTDTKVEARLMVAAEYDSILKEQTEDLQNQTKTLDWIERISDQLDPDEIISSEPYLDNLSQEVERLALAINETIKKTSKKQLYTPNKMSIETLTMKLEELKTEFEFQRGNQVSKLLNEIQNSNKLVQNQIKFLKKFINNYPSLPKSLESGENAKNKFNEIVVPELYEKKSNLNEELTLTKIENIKLKKQIEQLTANNRMIKNVYEISEYKFKKLSEDYRYLEDDYKNLEENYTNLNWRYQNERKENQLKQPSFNIYKEQPPEQTNILKYFFVLSIFMLLIGVLIGYMVPR